MKENVSKQNIENQNKRKQIKRKQSKIKQILNKSNQTSFSNTKCFAKLKKKKIKVK